MCIYLRTRVCWYVCAYFLYVHPGKCKFFLNNLKGVLFNRAGTVYRVIQRGSEQEIVSDNTGGAVYDAAIVLSRYLAAVEAPHMQGTSLLELGSGPALVSMIAARLVGDSGYVCATDGDEKTVTLAAENLALIPEKNTSSARFWWGTSPQDIAEMRGRSWDYIVASDVAYEPAVFEPLCEALLAVSTSSSKILLCNGSFSFSFVYNCAMHETWL